MTSYQKLLRMMIRNYIGGSILAVFGVGGVLIFSTLSISTREIRLLVLTLFISLFLMAGFEMLAFRYHLRPIRRAFLDENPSKETLQKAFLQIHRLPTLTLIRIIGPHWLGITLPGVGITVVEIQLGWLHFPYEYVFFAFLGSILIAAMHGMIEFFMTMRSTLPLIVMLEQKMQERYGERPTLHGRVIVPIRRKFQVSMIVVGTFPLLLFSLASQIHLAHSAVATATNYWQWAGIILVIGIAFSLFASWLISDSIANPIADLSHRLRAVEKGNYDVIASEQYSDEFSQLVRGFNLMVEGLIHRDALNARLIDSYFTTLAATLDARDPYTAGHSIRVAHLSVGIAAYMGLSEEVRSVIRRSGWLHDIGKIGIRDEILLKEGKLTSEEYEVMKQHPVIGEAILLSVQPSDYMLPLLPGVRWHHERYDGKGYPDGLQGDEIPLIARIMAVADAFDAITSDRPYRKGAPIEKAITILEEGRGTQWDPHYAQALIDWITADPITFAADLQASPSQVSLLLAQ